MSVQERNFIEFGNQTFKILCGSKGVYNYSDVVKTDIVFEQAKYHDEENPFPMKHRVLIVKYDFSLINRKAYVGICIKLKNQKKIFVYVSNKERIHNSDDFQKDVSLAKKIKNKLDKKIHT
ncbi:hypothetical protein [Faecalicoccus pleomorphus]|uniref:Uncharacterized protein n=1 Tax=Faecalicoccus pleomorphus TaxID=1323 RepID=A0A7X9NHE3_9FIRM|nr:hypothetical protein [Faecalicoccus pleomorphus]MBM6678638.1 hypothetical protein [Faecalicoccus pleomorphus]MBM6766289.1 hypothetical protein [Faecalicoccus pleomorphus]MDM8292023.1 hypothetical protein [Faecalicoccus pleomorphus]NME43896.1 hypothetical protein [Faecalicoccus pleomorphus]